MSSPVRRRSQLVQCLCISTTLHSFLKWTIIAYQRFVSPFLGIHCRYEPRCSEYALEAITVNGIVKGIGLTLLRVARCNVIFKGGYDPLRKV
ncbi:MAG: membrane protein insertion efficiency factor YidD [Candidatus Aureabacteria bacterium]|nr:membrane protein insertion efficiency factor YidD [Candidatus Auribacterota bacterium]